jgi:mono/diheme cytochrome c family protein
MKKRWIIALSVVSGVVATLLAGIVVLATGVVNIGADSEPGLIERTLAPWGRNRSVENRAPQEKDPYLGSPAAIAAGFEQYRNNCVMCHGAPGVAGADLSMGLNPPAPSLDKGENGVSDGEVFWIVKHGIRMTAMPAFGATRTDDDIWKIVAFVRTLPDLTTKERDTLKAATGEEGGRYEGETNGLEKSAGQAIRAPGKP